MNEYKESIIELLTEAEAYVSVIKDTLMRLISAIMSLKELID